MSHVPVSYLATNATSTDGTVSVLTNAIDEQLDREDKKEALRQLSKLVDSKPTTTYEWSKKITDFLYSYDGGFIPHDLSKRVSDEMYSIQKRLVQINPEYELTEEEIQSIVDEQSALYGELSKEEEAELEVVEQAKKVKADFIKQIRATPLGSENPSLRARIRRRLR